MAHLINNDNNIIINDNSAIVLCDFFLVDFGVKQARNPAANCGKHTCKNWKFCYSK